MSEFDFHKAIELKSHQGSQGSLKKYHHPVICKFEANRR